MLDAHVSRRGAETCKSRRPCRVRHVAIWLDMTIWNRDTGFEGRDLAISQSISMRAKPAPRSDLSTQAVVPHPPIDTLSGPRAV